jgi:hypothetical protein
MHTFSTIHKQPSRGFTFPGKDIIIRNIANNTLYDNAWHNLFITVEGNNVTMWLNFNPIPGEFGYSQYNFISGYPGSIDTMLKKLSSNDDTPHPCYMGLVTTISDKSMNYRNLSSESDCLKIWFGHIEMTIKKSYQFFPTLIRHIMQ